MGTRWYTSKCTAVGCAWRNRGPREDLLSTAESVHHNATSHSTFERGTELHTPDEDERPEREGREGDTQPMPVPNDGPSIHALVLADIQSRMALGIQRYGTRLQPHNGRNALRDAYEESLDLAVYLRQALYEQENPT